LTPFRASRFQQSIDNNPYFFNGPFTGVQLYVKIGDYALKIAKPPIFPRAFP
jgi:hypothetical protein